MGKTRSKSSFWVKLMRFAAYVTIVFGCLLSLLLGGTVIYSRVLERDTAGAILGVLIIVVGVVMSLIGSAAIMIFLDMANDLRAIRGQVERRP